MKNAGRSGIIGHTAARKFADRRAIKGLNRSKVRAENELTNTELEIIKSNLLRLSNQFLDSKEIDDDFIRDIDFSLELFKSTLPDFSLNLQPLNPSGSRRFRTSLLLLTLVMIFNQVAIDDKVANYKIDETIAELLASIIDTAKSTGSSISKTLEDSLQYCQKVAISSAISVSNARRRGGKAITNISVPEMVARVGVLSLANPVIVEGKSKVVRAVSKNEFQEFWDDCKSNNVDAVKEKIALSEVDGSIVQLLTSLDSRHKVSPLYVSINIGNSEIARIIISFANKRRPSLLREILLQNPSSSMSVFSLAVNLDRKLIVKYILDAIKSDPKLLGDLLLQKDVNGINPVLWAVSLNRFEIMQEILQTIDRNESLLEEVLNQVFDLGNGSTLLLHSIEKQKQEIAKIIIEFADKYPNLSYSVLTKIGKNGASPLYMACAVGNADLVEKILESAKKNQNIFKKNLTQLAGQRKYSSFMIAVDYGHYDIVLKMLSFATSNSDLLEKMLLHSEISVGDSALIKAALKGDYLMVREIIRAAKAVPGLLEKIMLNSNILGFNAIFAASHNGKEEVVLEILKELSDNEVLLGKILKIKPNNSSPSISVNFILLGSDEAIKLLLLKFPELKIDNLPPAYRCNIPQTAIYYLEAFCNVEFLQKGKKKPVYYQLQDDEFKDVKIDNIKLSGTPILVEIEGRRTMLAKDFDIEDKSSLIEIQNLFDLASKNKVNNIVFNISSNKPAHLVSLSFSKTEKGIWSCVINDPEQHELKIYKEFIESFAKNSGIKIKISNKDYRVSDNGKKIADGLGRGGVIIPNYKTQSMSGYCDMISSMVSAALILGEEFCQDLRGYCVQQGRSCIVDLGKKLNPEVDKILKKRFDLVKQEIQPSPIISEVLSVGLKSGDYKEL